MKRRKFLQVAGAATAGVAAGCSNGDTDHWLPYVTPPEDLVPGIPTYYASTCRECSAGCGVLVKTREARVIKLEGNPEHPVNRGRLCARGQAALEGLYDPDRVKQPMKRDGATWHPVSWDDAMAAIGPALGAAATSGPDRVAIVTGGMTGVVDALYDRFLGAFRSKRRLRYEAFALEPVREATRQVFGAATMPRYDFGAARYILSFGADFLETWISPTEFARGFADAHAYHDGKMAKYVACEPRRGMTSFSADEWVPPKPGTEHLLALGIANAIMRQGKAKVAGADADRLRGFLARFDGATVAAATGVDEATINRLATEFASADPSLAVAGGIAGQHRAATQTVVAAHLLNVVAGNVGRTISIPVSSAWDQVGGHTDLTHLVEAMGAGSVDVAFVIGTNPAFTAADPAAFAAAFDKVRLKVVFATAMDETALLADLVLPDHHALESWDAIDLMPGFTSLVQPAMNPVVDSRQAADVLMALAQANSRTVAPAGVSNARQLVAQGHKDIDVLLQHGMAGTPAAPRGAARLVTDFARLTYEAAAFDGADGLPLVPAPSSTLYDGRGANKPVLQELPDPATKMTWQSWVEVHPATATRLGIATGDIVRVAAGARHADAMVYVWPGVMKDMVSMPIGQGHTAYGRYAKDRGTNPLDLLAATATDPSGALAFSQVKVTLTKTGQRRVPATTEGSARQMGRGIARLVSYTAATSGTIPQREEPFTDAERRSIAAGAEAQHDEAYLGIYGQPQPKWEMTIDLSRCTGCSACVTACYTENNIPTVGEDQVQRGREMSWMRLERYFEGDTDGPDYQVAFTPMLCQQCANAPCEPVCPVYAAYHTPDGLNGQIYNRCVGTRYCANNCPYKVRYFNWWDYGRPGDPKFAFPGTLHIALNPDVTVRTKGVMEKCTFCVQRIRFAQNDARVRNRQLADGDITPACAQTCPSEAITFGNAHDPESRVSRLKRDDRGYHVLAELNTRPGITYLARVVHMAQSEEG